MKPIIWIVIGAAAIAILSIIIANIIIALVAKNEQLRADRSELITEKSKQSDQLRQKGIEIDELKKELDKYSDVEPKVALTGREKRMILNALDMPHYKALVQNPKTKFFIREMYRKLKEKIKESIKI